MSDAAQLWLKSSDKPCGEGPGMPHWCVKYVACVHCGSQPGELCVGKQGAWISHHFMRGRDYLQAKRAGKVPPIPSEERDAKVLYLTNLAREQGEAGEHHKNAHFTKLAILNLAKTVELLVSGKATK
jgi:hypothetical protein